ncbi:hypothetical protein ATKI12_8040 [Kitasatospora sp. Ki12]|nr:hypothetical protein [Kitasatospora xanthocidica]
MSSNDAEAASRRVTAEFLREHSAAELALLIRLEPAPSSALPSAPAPVG